MDGDKNKASENAEKPRRFYAGLSIGYVGYIDGGMTADYANETDAWKAPGSFKQSALQIDKRSVPIQVSLGARVIDNLRADISHMRYSGISMPGLVKTLSIGSNYYGHFSFHATGGNVSGSATMLDAYYNLDRLTGRFIGGKLSPYIGVGIGVGTTEISDYEVSDTGLYLMVENGIQTGKGASDIHAFHSGGKTDNLVYAFEAGGTSELFDRLLLDLFVRWTNLGRMRTKGDILLTQTAHDDDETPPTWSETLRFKGWRESGTLNFLDIGARLRWLF